jgi:Fungal specific transcription factor domain
VITTKPENEDGNEMDYEFNVKPEYARSPAQLMPPPRGPTTHASPFSTASWGNSPSWNENGSPNGFNNTPPYNNSFFSPRSEPSPKMSITSILCDPNDPNVYTPPQYEHSSNKSEQIAQPVQQTPVPATIPVVEATPLVTRTPPPLSFIPVLWKEVELHPSDESDIEEDEDDVEELPRESFIESDVIVPSPKRRRLNSHVPSDSYDIHAPYKEMEMWDFYDKVTSRILSCKNAQGENPWRDDLIQRANVSDPLKHALFAMTSFHMKRYRPDEAWSRSNHGLSYTNAAFRALRQLMADGKAFADENNIAAMLVLSFSQVRPFE